MARPVTIECGHRSAYKRHLARKEQPCQACKKANSEWQKKYRKR